MWLAQSGKGSEGVRTLVLDLEVRSCAAPCATTRCTERCLRAAREQPSRTSRSAPTRRRLRAQGTDGRERGEDDTAFEKQTALFAMASADVMLVNMWCHDIGREHGAGKPLLKTARAGAPRARRLTSLYSSPRLLARRHADAPRRRCSKLT